MLVKQLIILKVINQWKKSKQWIIDHNRSDALIFHIVIDPGYIIFVEEYLILVHWYLFYINVHNFKMSV